MSYTERLDKSTDTLYIAIRPGNHVRAMKGKTMLLREYLANEDLTQAQFASRIGVSRSTVSSWMRGLKAPGLSTLCESGISPITRSRSVDFLEFIGRSLVMHKNNIKRKRRKLAKLRRMLTNPALRSLALRLSLVWR